MSEVEGWPSVSEELSRKTVQALVALEKQRLSGEITVREHFLSVRAIFNATSGLVPEEVMDAMALSEPVVETIILAKPDASMIVVSRNEGRVLVEKHLGPKSLLVAKWVGLGDQGANEAFNFSVNHYKRQNCRVIANFNCVNKEGPNCG